MSSHTSPTVPDRKTATPAELLDFARRVGIPDTDLPATLPEPWRRVQLEGGYNFRDAGGYPGLGGRQVRRGLIWRSDHLHELTDDDLTAIDALDIRVVHDFRLDLEVDKQPSRRWTSNPAKVVRLVLSDMTGSEAAIEMIGDILAGRRPAPPGNFWDNNYLEMLNHGRHMFVGLFSSLTDPGSLPSLYHCTGGKDRTGIATVLLHAVLGVERETAINDFLFTNLYRTPYRVTALAPMLAANGVDPVAMIPVLGVCRSAIEVALDAIDSVYGGPERYLVDGGLAPHAPEQLRELLLEQPASGGRRA